MNRINRQLQAEAMEGSPPGRCAPKWWALAVLLPLLGSIPACKTEQTITTRDVRYMINEDTGDGKIGSADKGGVDKTRDKFGSSYADAFGEDEDGGDAKRSSMEGKMFGGGRDITSKEYRGAKEYGEVAEFEAPEYLKRQEVRMEDARENGRDSRAGQVSFRDGGREFSGADKELGFWEKMNPFRKRSTPAREQGRMFSAGDYAAGNRAQKEARTPEPMGAFGEGGYTGNSMSMDDVRKLLDPAAFRRN